MLAAAVCGSLPEEDVRGLAGCAKGLVRAAYWMKTGSGSSKSSSLSPTHYETSESAAIAWALVLCWRAAWEAWVEEAYEKGDVRAQRSQASTVVVEWESRQAELSH